MTKPDTHHHSMPATVTRDRHLPRNGVLAKDAVKKDGGGKANWGKLGEEFLDEEFTNPHRDPEPEPSVKFVNRDKQV